MSKKINCKNCTFSEVCHEVTTQNKNCAMFAQNPDQEIDSDGQPTEQKEFEDLEGIESEIYYDQEDY